MFYSNVKGFALYFLPSTKTILIQIVFLIAHKCINKKCTHSGSDFNQTKSVRFKIKEGQRI